MLALQVRRLLALTIIVAISAAGVAQSVPADSAVVHQTLVSRGVGKSIKVKETNGTTVNGTITAIDADSFQVTPKGETSRSASATRTSKPSTTAACAPA